MAMYGIAILPLITRLHNDSMTQKWYADDGSVVGKLKDFRALFDKLTQLGPKYGYFVNPPKCQLIIKPGGERQESTVFAGTNVEITGRSSPGIKYRKLLIDVEIKYTKSLDILGQFALTYPQNAYGGSTEVELPLAYYTFHGRGFGQGGGAAWPSHTAHCRQRSNPRGNFFLSLSEWVGLTSPSHKIFIKNLEQSIELPSPLAASFNNDSFEIQQCELEHTKISLRQKPDMQRELISKKSRIENNLPGMKYTIQLASEKGASSWLNALPLSKHGFNLTKTVPIWNSTPLHMRSEEHSNYMPMRERI